MPSIPHRPPSQIPPPVWRHLIRIPTVANIPETKMAPILIVGATRGLGASLTKQYAADPANTVYGTTRSKEGPQGFPENVKWLTGVNLTDSKVGETIASQLSTGDSKPLSTV
ncbi:hypothetical protein CTA2_2206, partial [Colletotrichum tanaceti]